jgi:hypothetical protein
MPRPRDVRFARRVYFVESEGSRHHLNHLNQPPTSMPHARFQPGAVPRSDAVQLFGTTVAVTAKDRCVMIVLQLPPPLRRVLRPLVAASSWRIASAPKGAAYPWLTLARDKS